MKKINHTFSVFLCLFILLSFFQIYAYAYEEYPFNVYLQESKDGRMIKVIINTKNFTEEKIAGFRCEIKYSEKQLSLSKVEVSSGICGKDLKYYNQGGTVTAVYVCNGKKAPELKGDCAAFIFTLKHGVEDGKLSAEISQAVTWEGRLLNGKYHENFMFKKGENPNSEAWLTELIPSDGVLIPEFSPRILKYSVYVPKTTKKLQFYAQAVNGGTVRVNRRTIDRNKPETLFKVTVISADKKMKQVYLINVYPKNLSAEEKAKAEKNRKNFLEHIKKEKAVEQEELSTAAQTEKKTNKKAKAAPLFLQNGQSGFFWGVVAGIGFVGCACLICFIIVRKSKK